MKYDESYRDGYYVGYGDGMRGIEYNPMGIEKKSLLDILNKEVPAIVFYLLLILLLEIAIIFKIKYDIVRIDYNELMDEMSQFAEIQLVSSEIKKIYERDSLLDDIDFDECMQGALLEFSNLIGDKYGVYMEPRKAKEAQEKYLGHSLDFGASMALEVDGRFYVYEVVKDSPAYNAGIREGDYISKLNGIEISADYINNLSYVDGETFIIEYERDGNGYVTELVLYDFYTPTVKAKLINDGVVYVKICNFYDNTDSEFRNCLDGCISKGYTDYIIDLRDNYGGKLETVVSMVDYMIPEGLIVSVTDKNGEVSDRYYSDEVEFIGNVVILVNEHTASASELFAQSLHDYEKAIIIGTNTYGKGTVVSEYTLSNGGTVVVSTGRYKTISGKDVEGVGVSLDYYVDMSYEHRFIFYKLPLYQDEQFMFAYRELKSDFNLVLDQFSIVELEIDRR